jgi:hypothetical protein
MRLRINNGIVIASCGLITLFLLAIGLLDVGSAYAQGTSFNQGRPGIRDGRPQSTTRPLSQGYQPLQQRGNAYPSFIPQEGYYPPPYAGSIYPGLPNWSATYVQPDGYNGYVFGNYCASPYGSYTVPSVYSLYTGFPGYIYIDSGFVQNIVPISGIVSYGPGYPSYPNPGYQLYEYTYNVNNYYTTPPSDSENQTPSTSSIQHAGTSAIQGSDQAFADVQQAWLTNNFQMFKKHLPQAGQKVAVAIEDKPSYAIESDRFGQITQDAFNKLTTYGFVLTFVQKQSDGSVTGYFTHTYAPVAENSGVRHTMYLAITLVNESGTWTITDIDSSTSAIGSAQTTPVTSDTDRG